MEAFEIGRFIKEFRERKNISQEDLCENICAISTLSRIERGVQYPSRSLLEAFFSRLGYTNKSIQVPLSSPDFRRSALEYEIMNLASQTNPDFLSLLEEYKNIKNEMDTLESQFYKFFLTLHKTMVKSCSTEEILNDFFDVIHITMVNYKIKDDITKHFLTKIELMTLLNISRTEYYLNNHDIAIFLMEQLENYYETHEISGEDIAANYPVILFNLSNWYGKKELFSKALDKANKGIQICTEYGKLHLLPYLIYNKGYSYLCLKEISRGVQIVTTAINLMIEMKKNEDAEYGIKYIKDTLNLDIPVKF